MIVTDIPGPRDIVINGKGGFLVKYTVENFIDKILYFFDLKRNNPEKFNGFGNKARENIQEKFEPSKIYDQLDNMFKEANGTA